MYHAIESGDGQILTSQNDLSDLTCTDEFWLLVKTLPNECPIPSQIIQLGLLIQHLEPVSDDMKVEISDNDILSATEAVVSARTLNRIIEILAKNTGHLSSSEKKRVGRFCEVTTLSQKNESRITDSEIIRAAKSHSNLRSLSFTSKNNTREQRKEPVGSSSSDTATSTSRRETTTGSRTQKSSESQPKKHSCDYCGREYSSPAGLRGHQQTCLKKKAADDSSSEKSTSTKSKSTRKRKRSTEQYQCDHCDKGFKRKKTMKYHQRKCGGKSSSKKSTSRVTSSEWRPDDGIKIRKNRGSERKTGRSPFADPDLIKETISKTASKRNRKKKKK